MNRPLKSLCCFGRTCMTKNVFVLSILTEMQIQLRLTETSFGNLSNKSTILNVIYVYFSPYYNV